jgi:hypothetical protein
MSDDEREQREQNERERDRTRLDRDYGRGLPGQGAESGRSGCFDALGSGCGMLIGLAVVLVVIVAIVS